MDAKDYLPDQLTRVIEEEGSHIFTAEMLDRAVHALTDLPGLKDDEPKVRNHSILVAAKLRHPSVIEPLLELLMDPYPLIRANAAQVLGYVADIRICGELIPLLESNYPIERECALKSLRRLSGEEYGFEIEDWQSWWDDYTTE